MAVLHSQLLCMWLLLLWAELPVSRPKCISDEVQAHIRPVRAASFHTQVLPNESHARQEQTRINSGRRAVNPLPIRIRTWFPEDSDSQFWPVKPSLEAAVEEAVRTVSSLLSVSRVTEPLLLKRDINKYCKFLWRNSSSVNFNRCGRANKTYRNETCLDVTIPDEHLEGCDIYPEKDSSQRAVLRSRGAGLPDTDFLLYLQVRATDKCRVEPKVRAYAVHCQTDSDGRPLAGVVVICRERLTGVAYDHHAIVQTVIHELFHALGFSKTLFGAWRDCSAPHHLGCSLRAKMIRPDAAGQMRIYSPSVITALQKHLQTNDTDVGGPLENMDAGPSGVSSHWESRVMQGSIMAPALGEPSTVRIDAVTLAALQDTGWYRADLEWAQGLVWGEGEGSLFGSPSTCKHNSTFFCSGRGFGCHYLHLHKGQCQSDRYLDECHIYKPIQNGSECWKIENAQQVAPDEMFGFESRCFFSSLTKQDHVMNSSVEGRCYKHRCTGRNKFQIHVHGSEWVDCPAGGAIQIKGYQGLVWCPDGRLCLPDVAPLPHVHFSSFDTSNHDKAKTQGVSWSYWKISALVIAASAGSLLLVLLVLLVTVSCRCWKVRVHSLQDQQSLHQTL